jgi:hypothetical protein
MWNEGNFTFSRLAAPKTRNAIAANNAPEIFASAPGRQNKQEAEQNRGFLFTVQSNYMINLNLF